MPDYERALTGEEQPGSAGDADGRDLQREPQAFQQKWGCADERGKVDHHGRGLPPVRLGSWTARSIRCMTCQAISAITR